MTGNMNENMRESPPIITAVSVNRAETIAVRATEHAIPVDLRISQEELRYGGERLAQQILTLCSKAAIEAGARHRVELEETGVPAAILDRLGLATRDELADVDAAEGQILPSSWMRSI
ncbi:hypothetical protein ACU5JM_10595 [Rhodococcus erythropolis]|uniref:hypothetical protein n=1 Tax=Rhodococcus erythropolis TaxID=1833 RepID=UPI00406BA0D7